MTQRGPHANLYRRSRSVRREIQARRIVPVGPLRYRRKSRPFLSDT